MKCIAIFEPHTPYSLTFFPMSPIKKVRKRNGEISDFNQEKITEAIWKAAQSVGGENRELSRQISNQVCAVLEVFFKSETDIPSVEQIQDLVEKILIEGGHAKTAKAYILYRERRKDLRNVQEDILSGKTSKLPFSINSLRVLAGRYLQRNENGEITETPEEMFDRVANALGSVEKQYDKSEKFIKEITDKFREAMYNFEFIPAGRTLTNIGGPTKLVANCIVLNIEDSMEGIFTTLREAALLQQAGSGLGFPWHLLRPAGYRAKATQGQASGPVSFLKVYDKAFGVIKQQGRHGANMGVMRVDHPDILEFIESKWEEGSLVNFNISVSLTDEFMEKVKNRSPEPWLCEWKGVKMKPRRIFRNSRGSFVKAVEENITAEELMDKIIDAAWRNGEPGVLFPDAAARSNPLPTLGRPEGTNPCGEQWLNGNDVCNLGSINLAKFVNNGEIKFDRLKEVTEIGVRMLDNVIDLSNFPVDSINKTFKSNRRVGLGIMGFADMLYQLKASYNSEEGREIAGKVMKTINETTHKYSEKLAKEKGTFPNWEVSIFGPKGQNIPRRNAALTTVAPTGSLSMVFDCSSGIEPFFALSYYKEVMSGQKLTYLNQYLEEELRKLNLYTEEIIDEIKSKGSLQHIKEIPENIKKVFVTAMDISADDHIKMQAIFQENIDNSISKTINFPHSATREDVKNGYILAWESGLKGCTVYRDGSRQEQVLNIESKPREHASISQPEVKTEKKPVQSNFEEIAIPPIKETVAVGVKAQEETAEEFEPQNKKEIIASKKCPECKSAIHISEGCLSCPNCGFSACTL